VDEIYNQIYVDIRCAIFHAKGGSHLVPQKMSDRKKVAEGLRKLGRLVMYLAEKLLQVRFPTGGFTYEAFNLMTKSVLQTSTIIVSDSDIPINKADTLESPAYKNALTMNTGPAPNLSEPGLYFILGSIGSADLCPLTKIGRFGIRNNDKLLAASTVETELKYSGIDMLEAQLGIQLRNVRELKRLYGA